MNLIPIRSHAPVSARCSRDSHASFLNPLRLGFATPLARAGRCTFHGVLFALAFLFFASGVQAYITPPNWEFRTHPNGELYWLYVPSNWQESAACPLVLGLHGSGWNGVVAAQPGRDPIYTAFHDYERNQQREPTFIVAPYSLGSWVTAGKAQRVMEVIESLRAEFPIDPQRMLLTGFSTGGAGVIQYLDLFPDTFCGGIVVAGNFSNFGSLKIENFQNVPIWGTVGTADRLLGRMNDLVAFLRGVNGFPHAVSPDDYGVLPRYSVFEGVPHGPEMEALLGMEEVIDWAYSLRKDGNAMPMVHFTAPTPSAATLLPGNTSSVTIAVEAVDPGGAVRQVEFFVDGTLVSTVTQPPYQVTVNGLQPGDHDLRAVVTDNGTDLGFAQNKVNEDRRTISITAPLVITLSELPAVRVGEFYRVELQASGINGEATWTESAPGLPSTLSLRPSGWIEGVFSEPGDYPVSLQVVDAKGVAATRALSIHVAPREINRVVLSNLQARDPAITLKPWRFAAGEPWGPIYYGYPGGAYDRQWHPRFDVMWDAGRLEGAISIRAPGESAAINSTGADWITFSTEIPVRVHVAYINTPSGTVPAWLGEQGFQTTGMVFHTLDYVFTDYAREFAPGVVTLGGNEAQATGAWEHYWIMVEPVLPVSGATVPFGQTATFGVPEQAGWTYQWFKDGVALSGENGPTLTVPNAQGYDIAAYHVTATDGGTSFTSEAAPLSIASLALINRGVVFNSSSVQGSVQQNVGTASTLNGDAAVAGDLLVPGTPSVRINGSPTYGGTSDGTGSAAPANYVITLNGGTMLNHVVRRTDPISLPLAAAPLPPTGGRNVVLNNSSQSVGDWSTVRNLTLNGKIAPLSVPGGRYGSFTLNGGNTITLGSPGAVEPVVYHLQSLTLNQNARVNVVGRVLLVVANGFNVNGGALGSAAHPEWLTLHVHGAMMLNSGARVDAYVLTPGDQVTLNSQTELVGGLASDRLTLNKDAHLELQGPASN